MDLIVGYGTDVGLQRQGKPNQDKVEVFFPNPPAAKPPLFLVADGMGGHRGGEQASSIITNSLLTFYQHTDLQDGFEVLLREGIQYAHQQLVQASLQDSELSNMGSTIAAVIIDGYQLFLANVGDTRVYLLDEENIHQLSWDHSFVGDLVRKNLITPQEALNHPKRNMLTMSLNAQRKELDIYLARQTLKPEDVVLICSDGLWGPVTEAQIHAVAWELPPQQAVLKLIELANRNQGPDNISVIIARYQLAAQPLKQLSDTHPTLEDTQP